jgi:hypothetical protein
MARKAARLVVGIGGLLTAVALVASSEHRPGILPASSPCYAYIADSVSGQGMLCGWRRIGAGCVDLTPPSLATRQRGADPLPRERVEDRRAGQIGSQGEVDDLWS